MVLYNRGSPQSRTSSIDSTLVDTTASNYASSASSVPAIEKLEGTRERPQTWKRGSLFPSRARSDTAPPTPTISASPLTRPPMDFRPRRSSHDTMSLYGEKRSILEKTGQRAKMFFSRNRSKRSSHRVSKLSMVPSLDEVEEQETGRDSDMYIDQQGLDGEVVRRPSISKPFNFQHVAHTQPKQFPALDTTTENELVGEYWAVRASQVPKAELIGIRADDLQSRRNTSIMELDEVPNRSTLSGAITPPLLSPTFMLEQTSTAQSSPSATRTPSERSLRKNRSVDSFSLPLRRNHSGRNSKGWVTPPTRRSSRYALNRAVEQSLPPQDSPTAPNFSFLTISRASTIYEPYVEPITQLTSSQSMQSLVVPDPGAHAVTTVDDIAAQLPPPSPFLFDVPEEADDYFSSKAIASSEDVLPQTFPRLRHAKSLPTIGKPRKVPRSVPEEPVPSLPTVKTVRPPSAASETLGSPIRLRPSLASRESTISVKRQSYRRSSRFIDMDMSWLDDIDYCYEHEAEAYCDFNWDDCSADEETKSDSGSGVFMASKRQHNLPKLDLADLDFSGDMETSSMRPSMALRFSMSSQSHLSLGVPDMHSLPSLTPRSTLTSSTNSHGIRTPSGFSFSHGDHIPMIPRFSGDYYGIALSPSSTVPQDWKIQLLREESENSDHSIGVAKQIAAGHDAHHDSCIATSHHRESGSSSISFRGFNKTKELDGLPELDFTYEISPVSPDRNTMDSFADFFASNFQLDTADGQANVQEEPKQEAQGSESTQPVETATSSPNDDGPAAMDERISGSGKASASSDERSSRTVSPVVKPAHKHKKTTSYTLSLFPAPPPIRKLVS